MNSPFNSKNGLFIHSKVKSVKVISKKHENYNDVNLCKRLFRLPEVIQNNCNDCYMCNDRSMKV